MKNKRIAILAAVAALMLVIVAAASAADASKPAVTMKGTPGPPVRNFNPNIKAARRYNIAIVVKSQSIPFWESNLIAAVNAGRALGVNVMQYAPTKADNMEEQMRILEDLMTKGLDCVVLAPANSIAARGPVSALVKRGIPVVYDNTLGAGDEYLSFVGVDDFEAGQVIGKAVSDRMGGKGKLLILEGVPGQETSDQRVKGIKNYISKHFPNIRFKAIAAHWQFDEGRKVTEDTLQSWPDLNGIVSVGGSMSEGAAEAVAAAGRQGKIIVGSVNLSAPTMAALKEGKLAFTVLQGVYEQGYWSVAACVQALNGKPVPRTIYTPLKVVIPSEADKYDESPEVLRKR